MIKISSHTVFYNGHIARIASLLCLALVLATIIVMEKYLLIVAVGGGVLYFALPLNVKLLLFGLACFFPISFGDFGAVEAFLWIEWMAPLILGLAFFHHFRSGKSFIPTKHRILVVAVCVLVLWALINYILHPVSAEKLLGATEERGGLRGYYSIFIGACVFFTGLFIGQKNDARKFWPVALKIILGFSLFIGILRIFSHYLGFEIPLVYGTFRYGANYLDELYGGAAYRIGGLSDAAGLGTAALLALRYEKRFGLKHLVVLLFFGFFIFMSGGRSFFMGLMAAIALYAFLSNLRKLMWFFIGLGIIVASFGWLARLNPFSGQLSRLFALRGGFEYQDPVRWEAYAYMWETFLENPIFGKGLGYTINIIPFSYFALDQLKSGGHGAYISILCLFGIGGIFFLFIILFGCLFKAIKILKTKKIFITGVNSFYVFLTILFTIKAIEYIVGGNGYSDTSLYLIAGVFAGFTQKNERIHAS